MLSGECVITQSSNDVVCIRLRDNRSRCQAVEVRLSYSNFASALMRIPAPCRFEWHPENIGKKREIKTEIVPFTLTYDSENQNRERAKAALKPFEKDWWVGHPEDLLSHRNRVKGEVEAYQVSFIRYV